MRYIFILLASTSLLASCGSDKAPAVSSEPTQKNLQEKVDTTNNGTLTGKTDNTTQSHTSNTHTEEKKESQQQSDKMKQEQKKMELEATKDIEDMIHTLEKEIELDTKTTKES